MHVSVMGRETHPVSMVIRILPNAGTAYPKGKVWRYLAVRTILKEVCRCGGASRSLGEAQLWSQVFGFNACVCRLLVGVESEYMARHGMGGVSFSQRSQPRYRCYPLASTNLRGKCCECNVRWLGNVHERYRDAT